MTVPNSSFVRFLQREHARLKDENKQLSKEVRALRHYVRSLQEFQQTIQRFTPEQDVLDLLDDTLDSALALLGASDGSLILLDEETEELVFVLVHGRIKETLPGYRFDKRQGIAGWVAENGESVIVNSPRTDPRFAPEIDERFGFKTRSLVAVPLSARGRILGVIEVLNKRADGDFTVDEAGLLSILGTLAASALDYASQCPSEPGQMKRSPNGSEPSAKGEGS